MSLENAGKTAENASASALVTEGLAALGNSASPTRSAATKPADAVAGADSATASAGKAAADGKDANAAAAPPGEFVAKADVEKMIADALAKQGTQQVAVGERDRYVQKHMADMPLSMQNLMPKTGDLKTLQQAHAALRDDLKLWIGAEVKAGRIRIPDVSGGDPSGGMSTAVNSKGNYGNADTPTNNVMAGLNQLKRP